MLDNVSKLNLYQYWFRNEGEHGMGLRINNKVERRREVGLLAQEVETVIPEAVHHTVRGYYVLITNMFMISYKNLSRHFIMVNFFYLIR